jgi:hypothetical protein
MFRARLKPAATFRVLASLVGSSTCCPSSLGRATRLAFSALITVNENSIEGVVR